jgi:hypothetical protein
MEPRKRLLLANAVSRSVIQAFKEKHKNDIVRNLLADDDQDDEGNRLRVLNDGDGVKLLMDVYTSYVSDDDFVKFPKFMRDVDTLLYKARGNRGLTKEDRIAMEQEADAAPKKGRKKKKGAPPPPPSDNSSGNDNSGNNSSTEITSSDLDTAVGDFFSRHLARKKA